MAERPFYIVDVFAQEKYAGSQVAVFRDTRGLSDQTIQRIAREMKAKWCAVDTRWDGVGGGTRILHRHGVYRSSLW